MHFRSATTVAVAALCAAACGKGANSSAPATAPAPATSTSTSTTTTSSTAMASAAPGITAQMVATGDSLYHARSCHNCHGPDAKGAQNGPDLTSGHFMHIDGSLNSLVHIITTGVPKDSIMDPSHRFAMNPRGGGRGAPITDDDVRDIAAYIYSLNHK